MKSQGKRLSILSLPEVQELYSVPQFSPHEREYFFSLTDDELEAVNRFDLYRNRIHLILMLGYFKVKPVCLVYGWKNIEDDYRYVSERYFPAASKQNKNLDRQTRSRLYSAVFDIVDYQRCDKTIESEMLTQLARRAKLYVDETQLFSTAVLLNFLPHPSLSTTWAAYQSLSDDATQSEAARRNRRWYMTLHRSQPRAGGSLRVRQAF